MAKTQQDRVVWMEALQAVKGKFPSMSSSEFIAQMGNTAVAVSTDKKRQRLLEEGVTEAVIQDSEQIISCF
ncbi:hypothetical protein RHMOL_Rhmol08G0001800 [Rhododendron molle]|uniref:Uncharacterized protein n=1 Tax=Rhododendron molle TaxID=49168 RepID=A0ACC0MJ56_RHOML|nr:hypothetical protein RHMOL_Rhmol08G0001800 [Rhododendron molle]